MVSKNTLLVALVFLASSVACELFHMRIKRGNKKVIVDLPLNATAIRKEIVDTFSCDYRHYGYYADVDNDCQVYHICLTQTLPLNNEQTFRWSFLCPKGKVFNQAEVTCDFPENSIKCIDSPIYYHLLERLFKQDGDASDEEEDDETLTLSDGSIVNRERSNKTEAALKKKANEPIFVGRQITPAKKGNKH